MTVIVWRDGVLAADRRVTAGAYPLPPVCKLLIGESDRFHFVAGMAGNCDSDARTLDLARAILDRDENPMMQGDVNALIYAVPKLGRGAKRLVEYVTEATDPQSSVVVYAGARIPRAHAIGSGFLAALGAMSAGADARRAVRIAARHVTECGDGVNWIDLNEPPSSWRVRSRKS